MNDTDILYRKVLFINIKRVLLDAYLCKKLKIALFHYWGCERELH